MTICAENVVLSRENTLNRPHQRTPFAGQVGRYFAVEISLEQVTRSYADAHRDALLAGVTRRVLVHGKAGVQPFTFHKHPAKRRAGAFRRD